MRLKSKKKSVVKKMRATAYASIGNFDKYVDTGDNKYLNDVHPRRGMKKGTEYYALAEGWEEKRIK
jgi:hypothetical protein